MRHVPHAPTAHRPLVLRPVSRVLLPMTHEPDWPLLARYVSGDAAPDEIADVERWLAASAEHRQTLLLLQRAWAESRRGGAPSLQAHAALAKLSARLDGEAFG